MSRFDQPQEPQQHDIIVALLVLLALVLLACWPNVLRAGLVWLEKYAK